MGTGISSWKSPSAAIRFQRLYTDATDSMLAELAQGGLPEAEVGDLGGRFGTTRWLRWAGNGEPVVLLHGHGTSWVSWGRLMPHLASRDVYALDTIGEPGGSTQTAPVTGAGDLVAWLEETLDGLALDRVALVGMSYGGWIAAHFAAAHSTRISALALLEPAIGAVTMGRMLRHGMLVGATPLLPPPLRRRAARRLDAEALVFDPRLRKPTAYAFRKFDRQIPAYAKLDDPMPEHILATITTPTLLVLGGGSELHHASEVAEQARRVIPELELHIIDGASHALPVTRPGTVGSLLGPFLDRTARH